MDAERLRAYLLTLPHVAETMQWGDNLVFWVGDKAIGGKMFCLINLDEPALTDRSTKPNPSQLATPPRGVLSFASAPTRFAELVEQDGFRPAPYLARAHWVAATVWDVFTPAEWRAELAAAHATVFRRLPPRTRKALALPPAELKRLIATSRADTK